MDERATLESLIDAGRILEAEGLRDFTRGHVSIRKPSDPSLFYMKPHSFGFDEITEENVVICNLDGDKVEGGGRRHSEVFIHSEIFRARDDIASVIHTHSPYAVAFAATGQAMEALSQPGALFFESLPVFAETIDLIRTPEQGRAVAAALASHKAVLLQGHGVVVAGASVEEAVIRSLMLENACMIQLAAKAAGAAPAPFSREDILALKRKIEEPEQFVLNFDYLRRKHGRRKEIQPNGE